ncbi:HEAT repeat domain-containing protein, partial [Chloroflexota bacterium]
LMTDRGNHYAIKGYATTHNMSITVALHLIFNTGLRYLTVKKERITMSRMRYVVSRGKQVCLATDRETRSVVKEYANNHNMTMTAALEPSPDKDQHAVELPPEISDKRTAEEKEQIADAMMEIVSDEAVAELLDSFRINPVTHSDSAKALVKIGNAKVVKPIIECLKRNGGFGSSIQDVTLNESLAWILFSIGEPVTEPLINVLKEDGDSRVQMWVIEILGNIGDGRASRPIIEHAI